MKKTISLAIAFLPVLIAITFNKSAAQMSKMDMRTASFKTTAADELRTTLRQLWEDHAMYTRNVILNIIDDLPGTNEAVVRLLQNQDDIGNAIKPVYGEEAGKKLSQLLHDHITIAADLLKAAKAGNQADFNSINDKWLKNADDISSFLNAANPKNWKLDDMKSMMHRHLDLTTQEAVARLKKDYKVDVEAFDKTRAELMDMSDMLAQGIINQFPDKFKN
ncbi:MAG TPA: hypothetical protein VG676_06430 [Chitinophagaceae bacterium]|jgi:hypothetical protein|nr:hypothetical protein [Chitinophagaceae bacterium]